MLLVRFAMSVYSAVKLKCFNAVIFTIRNAFANHLKSVSAATPSLFDAPTMNARNKYLREISAISSISNYIRNTKAILLRHTPMNMVILFLGVPLLIVDTCSSMRKEIRKDSSVYNVENSIV